MASNTASKTAADPDSDVASGPTREDTRRLGLIHFVVVVSTTALTVLAWVASNQAADATAIRDYAARAAQISDDFDQSLARSIDALEYLQVTGGAVQGQSDWDRLTDPWLGGQNHAGPTALARVALPDESAFPAQYESGPWPESVSISEHLAALPTDPDGQTTIGSVDLDIILGLPGPDATYLARLSVEDVTTRARMHLTDGLAVRILFEGQEIAAVGNVAEPNFLERHQSGTGSESLELLYSGNTSRHPTRSMQPTVILACGLVIDASIICLLILLSSSRKRTESSKEAMGDKLKAEKLQLEASNIALERYAQMSSHDLRPPLRALRDLHEDLDEHMNFRFPEAYEDAKIQSMKAQMSQMLHRMEHVIDGTLVYTQLSQHVRDVHTLDTKMLARRICDRFATDAISIKLQGNWPTVQCSLKLLTVILENLIQNAIQHHPHPNRAHVTLMSEVNETSFILHVSDDGVGIAEQLHDGIFDMFQTLGAPQEDMATGLGLAIVKRAVTLIGGHVSLRSHVGSGTTFTVMLHGVVRQSALPRQPAA